MHEHTLGFSLPSNLPAGYGVGCNCGSAYGQAVSQLAGSVSQPRGTRRTSSRLHLGEGDVCHSPHQRCFKPYRTEKVVPDSCRLCSSCVTKVLEGLMDASLYQGIMVCNTASLNPFWHSLSPSASPLLLLMERNIWPRICISEAANVFRSPLKYSEYLLFSSISFYTSYKPHILA